MKKNFFLFLFLSMIGFVHAQHCDSINNHFAGHYNLSPVDMIQLSDGNLLVEAWQDSLTTHDINQIPISYLIKYYKIRRHDVAILDSIWYENDNIRTRIMARLHNNGQIPSPTQTCKSGPTCFIPIQSMTD